MDVCRILNIHNAFTTTYHPQTNGQVERFNRTIVSAIRAYIGDHPRDWDLFTPSITYAYNCQPQTSTAYAPFELVLSKAPGPIALQAERSEPSTVRGYKAKWKSWLAKALGEAGKHLRSAQERYKRNYDERLRRDTERISKGDYVFLRSEKTGDKESRHKLAPIALGPYLVKAVDAKAKTVLIEYDDRTVENVSRTRVVRAPKRPTPDELQAVLKPRTIDQTIADFPLGEDINNLHVQKKDETDTAEPNDLPSDVPLGQRGRRKADKTKKQSENEDVHNSDEETVPHSTEGEPKENDVLKKN